MTAGAGRWDDLTVFVVTSGDEPLDECLEALARQTISFPVERVEGVHPMSAAFQAMPDRCRTRYFVQVDADMILEPDAVERLYEAIRASGPRTFQVSGPLWQDGFGVGGAVKCWKRGLFRAFRFRDRRTVDRDLYRRTVRLGLRRGFVEGTLGLHAAHHTPFAGYLKSKSDIEKWRYLGRPAEQYALPLLREQLAGVPDTRLRLLGTLVGVLSPWSRVERSKDAAYERRLFAELEPLTGVRGDALPAELVELVRRAYDGEGRVPLAEAVATTFGSGTAGAAWLLKTLDA